MKKTAEDLANLPWKKWQGFFMEDLAAIARQLDLNWETVKNCDENKFYHKSSMTYRPNKNKIAAYLRSQAIAKFSSSERGQGSN